MSTSLPVFDCKEGRGFLHQIRTVTMQGQPTFLTLASRHRVMSLHQWATYGDSFHRREAQAIVGLFASASVARARKGGLYVASIVTRQSLAARRRYEV